jgi:hypothetical protein
VPAQGRRRSSPAATACCTSCCARASPAKALAVAAEDVAGELVEQDDQRQAVQGRLFPVAQAAGHGLPHHGGAEACADVGIEFGAAAEPAFAEVLCGPFLVEAVAQPEVQDLGGRGVGVRRWEKGVGSVMATGSLAYQRSERSCRSQTPLRTA